MKTKGHGARTDREIPVRVQDKVNQRSIVDFLKQMITHNQCLMHLDLSETGLEQDGILELVQLLQDQQEADRGLSVKKQRRRIRNLRSVHFSYVKHPKWDDIVPAVRRILNPNTIMLEGK